MCDALQINWKLPSSMMMKKDHLHHNFRQDKNNNSSNNNCGGIIKKSSNSSSCKNNKYTLRACSIQKRIETETRKSQPRKRGPKPRPKPLPMSKYRRKTANQRERQRMGEINVAFEKLREKIPSPTSGKGRCEKMTKINILHVAINYIRALESILDTGDAGIQVYGTSLIQSPVSAVNAVNAAVAVAAATVGRGGSPLSDDYTAASPAGDSSEDSGIVDEDEDSIFSSKFPEWTELTSTLDFPGPPPLPPPPPSTSSPTISSSSSSPSLASTMKILNKDTLLTALNGRLFQSKVFKGGPAHDLFGPPTAVLDDTLLDLNSSFESLSEGLVDFSHEDPFDNLFF